MVNKSAQISTVSDNIRTLKARADIMGEQLEICNRQLMRLVSEDESDLHTVWKKYCQDTFFSSVADKAQLCRYLCEEWSTAEVLAHLDMLQDGEGTLAEAWGRIAYVRNKKNDKVFLDLSKKIKTARAFYAASFSEACEAVYNGICEFCILPVENEREGKLYSFYTMMDRFELKICRVIYEDTDNGANGIVYALVGRDISFDISDGEYKRFEFSVVHENADFVADVISAVKLFGGTVVIVGTQPVPYDELKSKYYLSVDLESASVLPLALYMYLDYPRYSPIGLYSIR